jgi:hypothetical protein
MTLSRFAVKEVLQACSGHLPDIQDTATETRPEGLALASDPDINYSQIFAQL